MKKFMSMAFMFTWFVFHTSSEDQVAKFLNALSAQSVKDAKIVTTSRGSFQDFYLFYNADAEVKLK